jgi:hypothetical protein
MSYTPKFCCECGEKIERTNWRLWTNRRFCQFCETNLGGRDLAYKVCFGILIVISIVGVGNFWRKPEKDLIVAQNQTISNSTNSGRNFAAQTNTAQNTNQTIASPSNQTKEIAAPETKLPLSVSKPSQKITANENQTATATAQEIVYFCGARTKKGTPCTHRVRGGRCWQHEGQPAMLPPEKLIASR